MDWLNDIRHEPPGRVERRVIVTSLSAFDAESDVVQLVPSGPGNGSA